MRERAVSGIMLTVLLIGMLTLAFNIQPVKASGTIYIRADGSVDPPTAPISTVDNVTYTFTDNIYADSIVIEKDDIGIDGNGYILYSTVGMRGFDISYRNNVTVRNTKIMKFNDGVYVYHSNSCKILNNIVTDCWYAIDVMHSSNNNTVSGNIVSDSYGGISVDYSSNDNTVTNNTVTNSKSNGWGLYLWASSGNVFSDNIAINNSKGMDIRNAVNNTIHHNNISGNQRGVYLSYSSNNIISQNNITANMEVGIYILTHSSNNIISGNIIANNTYHGLELYENSANNSIVGNTVINNQYGIWLHHYSDYNYIAKNSVTNNTVGIRLSESVTHNRISGNDILANSFGIGLMAFADNNLIYHNNFIDNTQHIEHTSLNVWDYGYPSGGNYWSDYTGVDADGDGIGDTPYVIDADNQDRYPLMHPWSPLPVHNINTGLGYATIQEAINANKTLNGHTIFVEAGTYYENIVINKSLWLIGENREGTIIDGGGASTVINVTSSNVTINGFTIMNSSLWGIFVASNYNLIQNNIVVKNTQVGIQLFSSHYNVIEKNNVFNNLQGITLGHSSHNKIELNYAKSNTVGIFLYYSNENVIKTNNVTDNILFGIQLSDHSSNNYVVENTVLNNANGIALTAAHNNIIKHNNFIDNTNQVYIWESEPSAWDGGYPSGGNYWSDYAGVDVKSGPNQDLPGSDGIGDTPYVIDANNRDRYPLMNPYGAPPPTTYTLSISTTVGGTTNPAPGTYIYIANSMVQVAATPNANYLFEYWELDSLNIGSANPYTVLMDKNHTLKAFFSPITLPLSTSISPLSASINVGQSATVTPTVSGGYTPYSYQWYLNGTPVSGATSKTWTFTPTTAGIHYVYLKVTDAKGNTAQSETARITAAAVPVGGYSIPIQVHTKAEPVIPYIALIAILTTIFAKVKRKTNRKH